MPEEDVALAGYYLPPSQPLSQSLSRLRSLPPACSRRDNLRLSAADFSYWTRGKSIARL